MCGLAGLLASGQWDPQLRDAALIAMAEAIAHRGPDGSALWSDPEAGIGLAHRRLAIIDLSSEGRQPMISASGRYVMAFNGEIYNFQSLRTELSGLGARYRGGSDTEVLLAAVERWGVPEALRRAAGMFALAVWDRWERRLHFGRDRLGKKPLYLAKHGTALLFGSELKALRAFPGYSPYVDVASVGLYLRYSYLPEASCIYVDATKLPPGTWWSVTAEEIPGLDIGSIHRKAQRYWSMLHVARQSRRPSGPDAADRLHDVLSLATAERLTADVPLGAFLSGGIDSSLVVALAVHHTPHRLRTFTVGFHEPGFDEAQHGRGIANALGTDHTELYVEPGHALEIIPRLPEVFDEPFADPSQIPMILISELARGHITVALSGDGGDETFGGYERYWRANALEKVYRLSPSVRNWIADRVREVPQAAWEIGLAVLPLAGGRRPSGQQIHRAAEIVGLADAASMYQREMIRWPDAPLACTHAATSLPPSPEARWGDLTDARDAERMMYIDSVGYLVSDVLVKVDRASMATGLEVRSPLLDHRVVEAAWQLPLSMKVRGRSGKVVLRELLGRYLPRELFERPKQGFGVPISDWLRGPLRDWADALLDEGRLCGEGLLRPEPVRRAWTQHVLGQEDHGFRLWTVLMLQAWLDHWRPAGAR